MNKTNAIQLSKGLRIRKLDDLNLVVEIFNGKNKKGWLVWGYYPSLESAFKAILKKELFDLPETREQIEGIVTAIERAESKVLKMVKRMKEELSNDNN